MSQYEHTTESDQNMYTDDVTYSPQGMDFTQHSTYPTAPIYYPYYPTVYVPIIYYYHPHMYSSYPFLPANYVPPPYSLSPSHPPPPPVSHVPPLDLNSLQEESLSTDTSLTQIESQAETTSCEQSVELQTEPTTCDQSIKQSVELQTKPTTCSSQSMTRSAKKHRRRQKSITKAVLEQSTVDPTSTLKLSSTEIILKPTSMEESSSSCDKTPKKQWGDDSSDSENKEGKEVHNTAAKNKIMQWLYDETKDELSIAKLKRVKIAQTMGYYGHLDDWKNPTRRITLLCSKTKVRTIRDGWLLFPIIPYKEWLDSYTVYRKNSKCLMCDQVFDMIYPKVFCKDCFIELRNGKHCKIEKLVLHQSLLYRLKYYFNFLHDIPTTHSYFGVCSKCDNRCFCIWFYGYRAMCIDCVIGIHDGKYPNGKYFDCSVNSLEVILDSYTKY